MAEEPILCIRKADRCKTGRRKPRGRPTESGGLRSVVAIPSVLPLTVSPWLLAWAREVVDARSKRVISIYRIDDRQRALVASKKLVALRTVLIDDPEGVALQVGEAAIPEAIIFVDFEKLVESSILRQLQPRNYWTQFSLNKMDRSVYYVQGGK